MKTPLQILSEQLNHPEEWFLQPFTGISCTEVLKFAKTLIAQSEQNKMLLMAEHQLTGFNTSYQGYSVTNLASDMGLTLEEWTALKARGIEWLSTRFIEELDEYFENKA